MLWVLRKNGTNQFVARSGSDKAYTKNLQAARVFASETAAQAEACGNETPVQTDLLLGQLTTFCQDF